MIFELLYTENLHIEEKRATLTEFLKKISATHNNMHGLKNLFLTQLVASRSGNLMIFSLKNQNSGEEISSFVYIYDLTIILVHLTKSMYWKDIVKSNTLVD